MLPINLVLAHLCLFLVSLPSFPMPPLPYLLSPVHVVHMLGYLRASNLALL